MCALWASVPKGKLCRVIISEFSCLSTVVSWTFYCNPFKTNGLFYRIDSISEAQGILAQGPKVAKEFLWPRDGA